MNGLIHKQEFIRLLANYHLSAKGAELVSQIQLVLLTGPTASGRNTVINELVKQGGYHFLVSDTTRQPRINDGKLESDGVEYHFRCETDMIEDIKKGAYLEVELIHGVQVSGISLRELEAAKTAGLIPINDVDLGGLMNITRIKPDTVGIILLPSSFDSWLERLKNRGVMSQDEMMKRMGTGLRIYLTTAQTAGTAVIVNDDLETAVKEVDNIVHGRQRPNNDNRLLAKELADQTKIFLNNVSEG